MTTTPPPLVDREALTQRRRRADPRALFLHRAAIDEVKDRLEMVNRPFTTPAVVTPFPDLWREGLTEARVVADDDTLALAPASHDLVIHAMALHWANDPVGQLIQSKRAMTPDGLCLVVLLGGQTLSELRTCLSQAESTVTGGLSPRVAPMAEIRDLGALLQRAGLALPVADSTTLTVEYRDMRHLMHDLRGMAETNAVAARLRRPTRRAVFDEASRLYSHHFPNATGGILATFELITLTGWAPAANQPKPLRPGSAQARLADALDTSETKLRD